jgi:hypothetical protein
MSGIEPKTIRAIQTGRSVLSLGPMAYMDMLKERYRVTSTKELTEDQGRDLIEHFRSLGFGRKKRKWTCNLCMPRKKREGIPENVIYPASPSQLGLIDELKKAVKWNHPDGFRLWLKKYFDLTEIKTSPEASLVIVALKGLIRSQKKCTGCVWKQGIPTMEEGQREPGTE